MIGCFPRLRNCIGNVISKYRAIVFECRDERIGQDPKTHTFSRAELINGRGEIKATSCGTLGFGRRLGRFLIALGNNDRLLGCVLGGPAGGTILSRDSPSRRLAEHQMRPLVAVQIIITVLHGNTRRPAGVKAGSRVCGPDRRCTRTLAHSRIPRNDSV